MLLRAVLRKVGKMCQAAGVQRPLHLDAAATRHHIAGCCPSTMSAMRHTSLKEVSQADPLKEAFAGFIPACSLPPDLSAVCLPLSAGPICCRRFLQSPQAPQGAAQAAEAHDEQLDSALQKSGKVIQIRDCYVQAPAKDSQDVVDQLRSLLIEVLQQKESFRKSEVQKLLKDRNVAIDDRTYARVVKEWCISKGNVWKLKPGASGT